MNLPSEAGSAAGGTNTPELDNYRRQVTHYSPANTELVPGVGDPRGTGLWAKLTFIVLESDR